MSKFESGTGGEKKETEFEAMIRKLRDEGYEFETADSGSVFTIKVPEKEIGIKKIPGVETEDGWKTFDEIVEDSVRKSAPKKEPPAEPSDSRDSEEKPGL